MKDYSLRNTRVFFIAFFLLSACDVEEKNESAPIAVSMIQLLSNPENFDGNKVNVGGYLSNGMGLNLFFVEEHAVYDDFISSINVMDDTESASLTKSSCLSRYVRITARFKLPFEHPSSGIVHRGLTDVEEVRRADDGSICWSRRGQSSPASADNSGDSEAN